MKLGQKGGFNLLNFLFQRIESRVDSGKLFVDGQLISPRRIASGSPSL